MGGYSKYSASQLWETVLDGYLQGAGHFATYSDLGFDAKGSPYMAVIDKSTMEILRVDAVSIMNDLDGVVTTCEELAPNR
ncbi:MAG: hypothetical protein V3V08_19485 [Nannocystaceae bacterium]